MKFIYLKTLISLIRNNYLLWNKLGNHRCLVLWRSRKCTFLIGSFFSFSYLYFPNFTHFTNKLKSKQRRNKIHLSKQFVLCKHLLTVPVILKVERKCITSNQQVKQKEYIPNYYKSEKKLDSKNKNAAMKKFEMYKLELGSYIYV